MFTALAFGDKMLNANQGNVINYLIKKLREQYHWEPPKAQRKFRVPTINVFVNKSASRVTAVISHETVIHSAVRLQRVVIAPTLPLYWLWVVGGRERPSTGHETDAAWRRPQPMYGRYHDTMVTLQPCACDCEWAQPASREATGRSIARYGVMSYHFVAKVTN